jgi:hypothetical protein
MLGRLPEPTAWISAGVQAQDPKEISRDDPFAVRFEEITDAESSERQEASAWERR